MLETFFTWLGNLDTLLGIFATLFSFLTWLNLRQRNRRYQELISREAPVIDFEERIQANQGVKSSAPVALALALLPNINAKSIRGDIERLIQRTEELSALTRIECIDINGINNLEDRKQFVTELRAMRRKLHEEGCTELHLFIAGPSAAAALAGAMFDNWIPVKLYASATNKIGDVRYEYWVPLDIVKGN
ncbi:MAG: SAVED domain-containing protein [Deinococcales bacterium]